jgi:NAD(P)H-hydrate epimerase
MRSLSRAEVRDVDRRAIADFGLPGIVLMENAGRNAAALLAELCPQGPVAIVCGKGNNAGDGFVIARHLETMDLEPRLLLAAAADGYAGDAAVNHGVAVKAGLPIVPLAEAGPADWTRELAGAAWIVDALLGTGATGAARGGIAVAIEAINAIRARGEARVFAVDLPSGLDCDSGLPLGPCVLADVTGTFVARKQGFDRRESEAYTGRVHVLDIGVPRRLLEACGVNGIPTKGC